MKETDDPEVPPGYWEELRREVETWPKISDKKLNDETEPFL